MNASAPARPALPDGVIALVPMRNVVLFPHVLVPITVGRAKSVAAVQHAHQTGAGLGIVLQRDAAIDDPGRDALYDVGTIAKVLQHVDADEQLQHAVCHGAVHGLLDDGLREHAVILARLCKFPLSDRQGREVEPTPPSCHS